MVDTHRAASNLLHRHYVSDDGCKRSQLVAKVASGPRARYYAAPRKKYDVYAAAAGPREAPTHENRGSDATRYPTRALSGRRKTGLEAETVGRHSITVIRFDAPPRRPRRTKEILPLRESKRQRIARTRQDTRERFREQWRKFISFRDKRDPRKRAIRLTISNFFLTHLSRLVIKAGFYFLLLFHL